MFRAAKQGKIRQGADVGKPFPIKGSTECPLIKVTKEKPAQKSTTTSETSTTATSETSNLTTNETSSSAADGSSKSEETTSSESEASNAEEDLSLRKPDDETNGASSDRSTNTGSEEADVTKKSESDQEHASESETPVSTMENGSGSAVSEPPKDMPEDLVAIRATLTDPIAIAEFDRMFERLRPKGFRAAIQGMLKKESLDDALVKLGNRTPEPPREVIVSLEVRREIERVQKSGDDLLQEISRYADDNPEIVGIPEWKKRLKEAGRVLDDLKSTEGDLSKKIEGQRRAIEAIKAELHVAQNTEGVTHVGKKIKMMKNGVEYMLDIDVVGKNGLEWVEVKSGETFGLGSGHWSEEAQAAQRRQKSQNGAEIGSQSKGRRGLKEQADLMLQASAQHKVNGKAPKVVVEFTKGVSSEVTEELGNMRYSDPVTHEVYTVEVRVHN